ncbi:RING-H2 finger protein ATL79-like [Sesamum indicum]|uniref:RING-type E3 ubiquitin transferase n=1 Tax=Sesamum indicum TaxID=4182 RepID=A0A6I9SX24_SESIN|nr:RING-H2 finger protein ATL79-like [Sesamum indicum]
MRKVPSLGTEAAVAMAEFNIHLSPPITTSTLAAPPHWPPAAPGNCDAQKCPWWPYSSSKDFKTNTALILVVLFCALICGLAFNAAIRYIISLHCSRRRQREASDEKADTGGAAAEQAAEIPSVIYSEGMKLTGADTECIICLSEFAIGEKIRVLEKCNHGFHLHCIQRWLVSHSSCPTCRTNCSTESSSSPP